MTLPRCFWAWILSNIIADDLVFCLLFWALVGSCKKFEQTLQLILSVVFPQDDIVQQTSRANCVVTSSHIHPRLSSLPVHDPG